MRSVFWGPRGPMPTSFPWATVLACAAVFGLLGACGSDTARNAGGPNGRRAEEVTEAPLVREFLVKTRHAADAERVREALADADDLKVEVGFDRARPLEGVDGEWRKMRVSLSSKRDRVDGEDLLARLSREPGVLWAEPNAAFRATLPTGGVLRAMDPDYRDAPELPTPPRVDPRMGSLYGHGRIGVPGAWQETLGSREVILASIDTGVDYTHEDIVNNLWRNPREIPGNGKDDDRNGYVDDVVGWDFKDGDARPWDDNRHGTHTAGIAAATGGNGRGLSGVTQKASIMVLRFLGGADGRGTLEGAVASVQYATRMGAHILNNSWEGDEYSKALEEAIVLADARGVLVVAAAGNAGRDNDVKPTWPASYALPNVVSVAATDTTDALAPFSNRGARGVHLAAPGVRILGPVPQDSYVFLSGTSMACPLVSGVAALLKARHPTLGGRALRSLLLSSVRPVSGLRGKVQTGGIVDASSALRLASQGFFDVR